MGPQESLDAHLVEGLGILADHADATGIRQARDGISITATGRGGTAFNNAWVTRPPQQPLATIRWAIDRLRSTGRPFLFQVPEPFVAALSDPFAKCGLVPTHRQPGMTLQVPANHPPVSQDLRVERVEDEQSLEAFSVSMAAGFGAPDPRASARTLPEGLLGDDRVTMLLGYAGSHPEPVATSVSVVAAGIAGVYAVTVHLSYRRRGWGEAITWAAVEAGRREGISLAALQATELGLPVYERMGFRRIREYVHYLPEAEALR